MNPTLRRSIVRLTVILMGVGLPLTATARAAEPLRLPPGDASFFAALDLSRPDMAAVKQAVAAKDWPAARAASAKHLTDRTSPRWLWSGRNRNAIEKLFADNYGGFKQFVPAANLVLERKFDFLGVKKTLTKDPQWNQGHNEWTHVLSRFAYFATLGKAYWATHDPKYAADYVYLLEHWVADNPAPETVVNNWHATDSRWRLLETGIRGYTWFSDFEFFRNAPEFDANAKTIVTRSLIEHARRLYAHETAFRQGNWQVCEAAGLTCIGVMLPECKEAAQWRQRGLQYLTEHMLKDVYPDGTQWEVTPGYHAWVTAEFLLASRLCQLNHIKTPPELMSRHEKMYDFLMQISKPNGRTFAVGDSGAAIAPSMAAGALLYDRKDFRWLGPHKLPKELIWTLGADAVNRYAHLPSQPPDPSSHLMRNSHFAIMRTGWQKNNKCLLFNCAPWGGGHDHRDRLEVCLYAGRDLLLDPGQISYDQKLSRTYFRTSKAHNVMTIDGREPPAKSPILLAWTTGPSADFVSGSLDYDGIHQQRCVLFVRPDYFIVVDRVSTTKGQGGEHTLQRAFHLPAGMAAISGSAAYTDAPNLPNISVIDADGTAAKLSSGWLPDHGSGAFVKAAPVIEFINQEMLPATHCTVLCPVTDPNQRPTVKHLPDSNPGQYRLQVSFPNGRTDEIVIGDGVHPLDLTVGHQHAHAWAMGINKTKSGMAVISAISSNKRQDVIRR